MSSEMAATRGAGVARVSWVGRAALLRQLALFPVLILALIVGALVNDAFLTYDNIINILQQSSVLGVLVVAEATILLAGKFDLSLESTVAFAPMLIGWLISAEAIGGLAWGIPPGVALILVFLVGAAVGLINGVLSVRLALNAFMVTLAMQILLRGLTLGIADGKTLYNLPSAFTYLGMAEWLTIPVSIWIAGLLFLVAGLFLRYHRAGRAIYAIGGNPEAARAAGIRVERTMLVLFVVGGVLAALAGLMLTGRIASVTANQGQNMIFTVFAASVIGGISLNGGRGRMVGALSGVLLLGTIQNILTLSRVSSFWIDASFGAIILVALVVARITGDKAEE